MPFYPLLSSRLHDSACHCGLPIKLRQCLSLRSAVLSAAVLHFWAPPGGDDGRAANGWGAVVRHCLCLACPLVSCLRRRPSVRTTFQAGAEPVCSVLLEPRSLLVFAGKAYHILLHGIRPVISERPPFRGRAQDAHRPFLSRF